MADAYQAFIQGMARIVDLFGVAQSPEVERILNTSDAAALRADWQAVGDDLREAMREYELASPTPPHD